MNRNEQIEQRLRAVEAPEAPASLRDRILSEIPDDLASAEPARHEAGARWWQIAAAMILMIGGAWLAMTWTRDTPVPLSAPERRVSGDAARTAPVPTSPANPPTAESRSQEAQPLDAISAVTGYSQIGIPEQDSARGRVSPEAAAAQNDESFAAAAPVAVTADASVRSESQARVEQGGVEGGVEGGVVGGVVGGTIAKKSEPTRVFELKEGRGARRMTVATPVAAAPPPPPSTGGTAEPNDQPYGDVFFQTYGTNPFIDTEDDAQSTFGLDVDTGSWGVARRYLSDGHLPPAEAIRVEEILNSFKYGDRAPVRDDFAIHSDAAPWPFARGERYHALRFGIRSREVSAANRKPATLIFTVDVSGSMAREDRLELVKRALEILIGQLDERDRIGLVVYGTNGEVLLEPTSDHEAIRRAIGRLTPQGSTNAEEGLTLAYRLAERYYRRGEINRVILCSDGVANVGRTGPESILESIGESARRGIELTTVGFGMGNYNDVLMEQLADRGNGQYAYVDSLAEARKVFVENLTATLQTVARDTKVQVEFEPSAVARYRLVGYENRDIADERFRDDSVDAGEIGAGHAVTALYEIKLQPDLSRNARIATLRLRYKDVDNGDRVREIEHAVYARDIVSDWSEAPRALRLATLTATFGEVLKRSYWAKEVNLDLLTRRIEALATEMRNPDVDELALMARRAARLIGESRQ
ncbi:MAG TPA: von Willebrand factor type A domain-containing protein [Thermoanaerobaculia bacterium]|nr:von Willebrand factor type A domain-containing protein [Thermoanaerobaculia bacterium]